MPRLWNATIEQHRREVQRAILDTTSALVSEHGVLSVTMAQIAEATGIGRATLYKYFPDLQAILTAWHKRVVDDHLSSLADIVRGSGSARGKLEALATTYAHICQTRERHAAEEVGGLLHRGPHAASGHQGLHDLFRAVLSEAVETGEVRNDISVDELTGFCIHALAAAGSLSSEAAVQRLVAITLDAAAPRS